MILPWVKISHVISSYVRKEPMLFVPLLGLALFYGIEISLMVLT